MKFHKVKVCCCYFKKLILTDLTHFPQFIKFSHFNVVIIMKNVFTAKGKQKYKVSLQNICSVCVCVCVCACI